jgi:hypothetical protein
MVRANKSQAAGEGKRAATKKKAAGRGAAKLSKIVDQKLTDKSEALAEKLMQIAVGGDLNFTKFVVSLSREAGGTTNCGAQRLAISLANRLADERQWRGTVSEAEAETDAGSREPEG